jgi:hypothetical protein
MTFYLPELLNCDTLTHLTYLFPKCSHHIFFLKKKNPKNKKNMMGWFGHTQAGRLGVAEPPPVAHGVVMPPFGPNEQISIWAKGQPNHLVGHWGWFRRPRPVGLRVAEPLLVAQGVVRPPLGPIAQNFVFGCLAQGAAEPPP